MKRSDISSNLVHFTSGADYEDSFERLQKILSDRKLIGGARCIKGRYNCVCFSEAPLPTLGERGLVNDSYYSRYSPFGIVVSKRWLFSVGGRPVIYQPDAEYENLPESHRWRHVRYDLPEKSPTTDFTWEREWRIHAEHLEFDHISAKIVVLNGSWAERLVKKHQSDQDYVVMDYSLIFDDALIAEAYRERFQWTILTLT